jgi:hypothetical protein
MYRDKEQLEVDVVIVNGLGQLVGVEVKAAASVQAAHGAGLRRLASQAGDRFLGGVILPGLADVVLLITILVAFLETGSSTVRRLRPSLF